MLCVGAWHHTFYCSRWFAGYVRGSVCLWCGVPIVVPGVLGWLWFFLVCLFGCYLCVACGSIASYK
jgi:hypothetical protein